MTKKTVLIFTGGGLAPALNSTLYGVITQAQREGFKILGGMYGWASLLDNGRIIDLTKINVKPIKNIGGTFLRSSRTNPFRIEDGIRQIKDKIKKYEIDCIIAIGGNDTIKAADDLLKQEGISVVCIPKTIDNDLPETYWTPGFPSGAYYFSNYVKEIREDAAYALSRIYIVESMGQDAGWLTASGAYGDADIIIPPEKEIKTNNFLKLLEKKYKENGDFAVVAVAEQAKFDQPIEGINQDQTDSFNIKRSQFISIALKNLIKEKLAINAKALVPGNYLESGRPTRIDQKYAIKLGQKSIDLIKKEKFGRMARLERINNKIKVSSIPLKDVFAKTKLKTLDENLFDFDNLTVKDKLLDYLEPILGKYQVKKSKYCKLMKKITTS